MVKKSHFLKIVFQFFLSFKLVYYEINKLNNTKSYIQKINYFWFFSIYFEEIARLNKKISIKNE